MRPVVTHSRPMNRVKSSAENPMSCSRLITRTAKAQASTMGTSGLGSRTSRLPNRAVGMVSSSRLSAKYEAKKMQSTILASSMGWNSKELTWIHRRAPPMLAPRPGTSGRSSSTTPKPSSRYR